MELALAKNPNIRTKSVGELATAVGRAYGLEGDHRAWARTPQAELKRLVAEGLARAPARAPRPAPALEASADPFAAPMTGPSGTNRMTNPAPVQHAPAHPYMQGQQSMQHQQGRHDDVQPAGIPGLDVGGRPPWLIPLAVGLAALVVGGGLVVLLTR